MKLNDPVKKVGGPFEYTGVIRAVFTTTHGDERVAVEFDPPIGGVVRILRPSELELLTRKE